MFFYKNIKLLKNLRENTIKYYVFLKRTIKYKND